MQPSQSWSFSLVSPHSAQVQPSHACRRGSVFSHFTHVQFDHS